MNKREVIRNVSVRSGVDDEVCVKVLYALEEVLSEELAYGRGQNKFDFVYKVMTFIKRKKETKK